MTFRPVTLATLDREQIADLDVIRRGHGVLVQRARLKLFVRLGLAAWRLDAKRRKVWSLTDLGRDVLGATAVVGRRVPPSYKPPSGYVTGPKAPLEKDYYQKGQRVR